MLATATRTPLSTTSAPVSTIAPSAYTLRSDQVAAIEAADSAIERGVRRSVIEMPTGSGKTVCFATWATKFVARGDRVLVLVHTDDLVRQTVEKLTDCGVPADSVGIVKAEKGEHTTLVVVASVQTLSRPHRLARVTPDFALVIVDECHHAAAATYRRVLDHVGQSNPVVSGWTGTAFRADKTELIGPAGVFEELSYSVATAEMIRRGVLSDLRVIRFSIGYSADNVRRSGGDFVASGLTAVMRSVNALPKIVAGYAREIPGKRAVVFVPTVDIAEDLAKAFQVDGRWPAAFVTGDTPLHERRALVKDFRAGRVLVVVNCAVWSEGFDEPLIEGVILARPTLSPVLFRQQIGRGLRQILNQPGKVCTVLDFADVTKRHDVMNVSHVLGVTLRDGETALEAIARHEVETEAATVTAELRGRMVAERVEMFRTDRPHWSIGKSGGVFSLWLGSEGTLDVIPDAPVLTGPVDEIVDAPGTWRVLKIDKFDRHNPNRRMVDTALVTGLQLPNALLWVEEYADRVGALDFINRTENRQPASADQIAAYAKIAPVPAGLTRAQASAVIGANKADSRQRSRERGKRVVRVGQVGRVAK